MKQVLKYVNTEIVFREIPDEITLAINLSNCPHRCIGCHSPYLQQDLGEELNETSLVELIGKYEKSVTCICFMGGDAAPREVCRLARFVRLQWNCKLKTAWYSGCRKIPETVSAENFNFIKLGAYVAKLGGLNVASTNQRLYKIHNGVFNDITSLLQK
ncbi:MAG: anaerobic ribonucleoside-triphosphate reductase activating protein [Porphyromonadaceae bacterium]|jgi:anaerobic ribonucleoside-triphosphate reductase activating protein|nr:anaerobic ribonucleoside-triphosphate reductase activating protein [Porphyromonadaceae bacterium]